MELVEKYKDIPDTEFVPLECVREELLGCYEINKLGQIRTVSTGVIRSKPTKRSDGYPYYGFSNLKENIHCIYLLHVLLARTFIQNPNNYPIIHHRDKNRENYSLTNLEFVTYKHNNSDKNFIESRNVIYIKLDDNLKEIGREISSDLSKEELRRITSAICNNIKYKGVYWSRLYPDVENYIKRYGEPKEDDWKVCLRDDYFEVNKNGLVRVRNTKRITLGCGSSGYWRIKRKLKDGSSVTYRIHRLVYETFSGRLLEDNEVVDHLSTDTFDNRFCNLSAGSQKDNMSNPITKSKKSKKILKFSLEGELIKEYSSVKEAKLEHLGENTLSYRLSKHKYSFNAFWCYEGEEWKISEKVKTVIFKYNKDYNLVDTFLTINSASESVPTSSSGHTIKKYIDTGKLAPDGHYYYHGPHKFTDDEQK